MPLDPPMSASASLIPIVEQAEGFLPTIGSDEGNPVIGFGCDLSASEVEHYQTIQPITRDEGVDLLMARIVPVEHVINRLINVPITQNQFDACCDFVYNEGSGHFASSTLLKLMNLGRMEDAANEFLKWDIAGGQVFPGLLARRQAERALFLT